MTRFNAIYNEAEFIARAVMDNHWTAMTNEANGTEIGKAMLAEMMERVERIYSANTDKLSADDKNELVAISMRSMMYEVRRWNYTCMQHEKLWGHNACTQTVLDMFTGILDRAQASVNA